MPKRATLHVPLDQILYEKLKQRATDMGFDSPQAYIRFWATAETTGPLNPGGVSMYQDLTSPKAQAMRYVELVLSLKSGDFHSTDHALRHLDSQLRYRSFKKSFKELIKLDREGIL